MEEPTGSATKAICSICFDDLRPVLEDLHAIPVCGHVFHSHCLQQWFEYCPKTKKHSCPVCKQTCAANQVCRLYFQSLGEGNDSSHAVPVACGREEDYPTVLRKELKILNAKVRNDLKVLNDKMQHFGELLKKEASLKKDALKEKMDIQQLLHLKSQELDKVTLECLGLQDRNMALAKELAALKLTADLNLVEDEIIKLSCVGNEFNSKDTIDVLQKSLVIRNNLDKCVACDKTVYPLEKVTMEGECYHKTCFRCAHGGCTLTHSSYAALDGVLYCRHHFARLFIEKGDYKHVLESAAHKRSASNSSPPHPEPAESEAASEDKEETEEQHHE